MKHFTITLNVAGNTITHTIEARSKTQAMWDAVMQHSSAQVLSIEEGRG